MLLNMERNSKTNSAETRTAAACGALVAIMTNRPYTIRQQKLKTILMKQTFRLLTLFLATLLVSCNSYGQKKDDYSSKIDSLIKTTNPRSSAE